MKKNDIAIIIVTFNSQKYIENCLYSVLENIPKKYSYRIVIIDNNSKDNTLKVINKVFKNKHLEIYVNDFNKGFSQAVNRGINIAKGSKYYLLLNPDTIIKSGSIKNLIDSLNKNKAGICGGSTYNKSGIENGSYFRFPTLLIGIFDFTNLRKLDKKDRYHKIFYYKDTAIKNDTCFPVDVVTGGFMMIRSETIDTIGLLSEKYFMYLEDVDYCYKANKNNIKVFHCNNSKIIHFSGRSSSNKDRIRHSSWIISRKIYFLEHFNLIENLLIQPLFLLDDLIILANKYLK